MRTDLGCQPAFGRFRPESRRSSCSHSTCLLPHLHLLIIAICHTVQESAAKTALMLNGGTLDGSQISVTSSSLEAPAVAQQPATTSSAPTTAHSTTGDEDHVEQEDKPRSAVLAEYLAAGYKLSDQVIERGIQADQRTFRRSMSSEAHA